jgi:hypothetical protein
LLSGAITWLTVLSCQIELSDSAAEMLLKWSNREKPIHRSYSNQHCFCCCFCLFLLLARTVQATIVWPAGAVWSAQTVFWFCGCKLRFLLLSACPAIYRTYVSCKIHPQCWI